MVDISYFLALFLIFLRITSYFMAVQIFFPTGTPQIMQGVFSLILSFGIVAGIDHSTVSAVNSSYMLVFYAISEIMSGLILGYITNLIFQVVKLAGEWMDIHAGFSMVSVLDPTTQTTSTLLGNLSYFISLAFFFIVDGHHVVINMLVESTKIIPIGKTIVYQETLMEVMKTIFDYFTLGVKIAIPIVLIIVITDVCLGLISRTVPTIPIMILGMPIKNLLGLITYIILLPLMLKLIGTAIYNLPSIFREIVNLISAIPLVLIFAGDDKTEEATPKKKSESRNKGQIARSKDVSVAITMVICTLLISSLWGMLTNGFKEVLIYFFNFPMIGDFNHATISNLAITTVIKIGSYLLPFALPIMVGGVIASLLQTGFIITAEPLKPSFGKLNPLSGLKNMISKRSIVDLSKNLVVITIVSIICYKYISGNYQSILGISNLYLPSLSDEVKNLVVGIFKQICIVLVIIAGIDYFLQVRMHNKEMRMTKQEVKDEYKQSEGDPKIKGKIKQRQRELGMKRMMQSVADATVVITNPTHLAIAIKYEEGKDMEAPKVVAKGADYVAFKIKSIAKENEVPVIENKPLARLMYDRVEVDQDIPQDLYQAVAEILVVVMKLKKK
ncbi:fused FliR family export protein/FlhB family type III secretion system protein [Clostridium beijerinckii]|jgi:flagellar biosynthetic protein FlhB|uniref:Flagellar biosynthetic protein FlhB n=2 Tax=Clostridium beijerinckii TaxID=1520 RepID=A0AAE2UXY5_CLOBE|nr:fused FliR family export protein/FlhB family type III secretion system protein [Clostridium beijerinckii]ABR36364.1 flagellar biosynthetic protein FlhB [Clostridium beijerinckii NCIMB 8052]AIU00660.1 bifunctional flagellar biosynthesis protein FliR/FlhB [Clostridium beijerinckii ATCC 35702]MBF7808990.1 fused FliR family export protein/FlhB family type III secretion system protein [Clostridium beijerinckii]NRT22573.1 flagellar biosynthetic protein FliR/FlhB [Clostridium beijerinckii]NRT64910